MPRSKDVPTIDKHADGVERRSPRRLSMEKRLEQILEISERLISENGVHNFKLDDVIEEFTFSRNIFFKQINTKETLFAYLAIKGLNYWISLMNRVRKWDGYSREKILAIHLSGLIFEYSNPVLYYSLFGMGTFIYRDNLNSDVCAILDKKVNTVIKMLQRTIDEGIKNNELKLRKGISSYDFAFSVWCSRFGYLAMLKQHNIKNSESSYFKPYMRLISDKLEWHPLSTEYDYDAAAKKIVEELFLKEYMVAAKGKPDLFA